MDAYDSNWQESPALRLLIEQYQTKAERGEVPYWEQESFLMLIDYFDDQVQIDKALEVTEAAIEQHQYSAALYIRKAQLLIEKDKFESATVALERATLFEPSNIEIYLTKCDLYMRQNDPQEALDILAEAHYLADGEDLADLYILEATIYEIQDNYKKSIQCLKKALKKDPKNTLALNRLWIALDMEGNHKEAIDWHLDFVDEYPYSYWAWYNLGLAYNAVGLLEKATESFDYAIVINDQFEPAYHDYIVNLLQLEEYEVALRYLSEYQTFFEPDAEIWYRLGLCYESLQKYSQARDFYYKALEINALNGEVYYHIGNCFVEEQQLDKAIEAYLQACNSNKKNAEFRLTLADTYDANGNSEAAAEYYQQAIELSPEDTLVWIHYIEFLIDEESYEMALELLQEARKHTEDLLLDCVHAAILLESGSRKEGFVILGNILAEDAGMSEQLFEIAPLLEGDEELQQFIKSYR
jgi:tetratricopeptide (TPR) repeat protein